jgi:hypothetical protein
MDIDSSQAGEIAINLTKMDDGSLTGTLMDSFETKARRIKRSEGSFRVFVIISEYKGNLFRLPFFIDQPLGRDHP